MQGRVLGGNSLLRHFLHFITHRAYADCRHCVIAWERACSRKEPDGWYPRKPHYFSGWDAPVVRVNDERYVPPRWQSLCGAPGPSSSPLSGPFCARPRGHSLVGPDAHRGMGVHTGFVWSDAEAREQLRCIEELWRVVYEG